MFEAYTTTTTTYNTDQPIVFTSPRYTDCRITMTSGTSFTINTPGRYVISFTGVGSSGTAASQFSIQLYKNGVAVPAVRSALTSTVATDPHSLAFTTIVSALPSCCAVDNRDTYQIVVTSTNAGNLYNGDLVIYRLR